METLLTTLTQHGFDPYMSENGKHYRVFITSRKSIKQFADWIYHDKSLYLKRKYDAFAQETFTADELHDRKRNRDRK